ncbi:MAG: hypothetical protein KME08_03580 [Aphanothece sp. CMT-3BRIN-NPC111]|nr:hypothetical protein [Aphanothece sp. CMT-3BRIN-NPC111]
MKIKTQLVPVLTRLLARTSLGVLAGMGVASCLLPQPSLAQSAYPSSSDNLNEGNNNPFSSRYDDSGFSPLDMIHRAQLGTLRSFDEFNSEQSESLNNAADEFRRQQIERLRQQNQVSPVQQVTTPPANN